MNKDIWKKRMIINNKEAEVLWSAMIGTPCETLEILYDILDNEIEEQLKTEELAGPFDEEWIKDMQIKKEIKETFEKLVKKCKAKKLGKYYEDKINERLK